MQIEMSITTKNLGALNEDLEFMNVKLSSNIDFLKNKILNSDFKKAIGLFAVDAYNKSPYFYLKTEYLDSELSLTEDSKKIIDANTELYLVVFNHLMSFLWLQKDNCCNIGTIYTYLPEYKTVFEKTNGFNYSKSRGQLYEKSSFTNEDILEAFLRYAKISSKFYHRNIAISTSDQPQPNPFINRTITPYDIKKETRLERAFNFLNLARKARVLPEKIAFFICIYEALFFGKDSGEISHQISERVALYASKTRVFRHGIYKLVKEAYRIRSTYFHGNSFGQANLTKMADTAERIDILTRQILNKIVDKDADIFLQSSEHLENSFMDLLFEDTRKPDGTTIEKGLAHLRFNR